MKLDVFSYYLVDMREINTRSDVKVAKVFTVPDGDENRVEMLFLERQRSQSNVPRFKLLDEPSTVDRKCIKARIRNWRQYNNGEFGFPDLDKVKSSLCNSVTIQK